MQDSKFFNPEITKKIYRVINSLVIDHGSSNKLGCRGALEKIARLKKTERFLQSFSKRHSFFWGELEKPVSPRSMTWLLVDGRLVITYRKKIDKCVDVSCSSEDFEEDSSSGNTWAGCQVESRLEENNKIDSKFLKNL